MTTTDTYAFTASGSLIRGSDQAFIPVDPANRDYQAYLASGIAATPYVAPPAPTPSCQLWQLQSVMTVAQWTAIQANITTLNNPAVTAFFQHGTNTIPANSTTLLSLGEQIGLTADQITALITQASSVFVP
jgi:hypothetical protein